ncbi:MAG: DUF533 domain-containing protein [Planctomycetales bacterium]|nr:DUF533 domain-containing protein [Planctomycetales bacterium]
MDPIDILGSLLGGSRGTGASQGGGGLGGKILGDLLNGQRKPTSSSTSTSHGKTKPSHELPGRVTDVAQHARELEDILGVARERSANSSSRNVTPPAQSRPAPTQPPRNWPQPPSFEEVGNRYGQGTTRIQTPKANPPPQFNPSDEVVVLIRAMINAAKADGQITNDEQQAILGRIQNPTQATIDFLRSEFSSALDVREFAWNVPIGLEEKVYMLSLSVIDLDSNPEAAYLRDLAHGLRISQDKCHAIHQQLGAPQLR